MPVYAIMAVGLFAASAFLTSLPAQADGRAERDACQAMLDRAAQAAAKSDARQDEAVLARCRQIIRDWTLRESRMSVDEQGRPLR